VKRLFGDRNRSLLFRSYLYLAGGLLLVAIVLDMGFSYLQSSQSPAVDPWLETTFHLLEARLAAVPEDEREATAQALSETLGVGVQLLGSDDIVTATAAEHQRIALVDADHNKSYLHDAPQLDAILRLGPVTEPQDRLLVRLLPPLFYLSIFVVVGIWLRPLLKDINRIADGAQRFAADYREPISTTGEVSELTGLAKNIDEMSARISGLLRSQKELITALSHEMRTPLARIRFALAVISSKDDPRLQGQVEALDADVQEIDDLIGSMLSYARLDHPEVRMHWQEVPLENWLQLIIGKSGVDGIDIALDATNGPRKAWMDPRLMELALSNLLVNACRYSKHAVRCVASQSNHEYLLAVEDDGRGIPEADREIIFKAFSRIDDSRNRETGGYGLGLAIVARIAQLHGGTASVETSTELGGAKFQIRWSYAGKS